MLPWRTAYARALFAKGHSAASDELINGSAQKTDFAKSRERPKPITRRVADMLRSQPVLPQFAANTKCKVG